MKNAARGYLTLGASLLWKEDQRRMSRPESEKHGQRLTCLTKSGRPETYASRPNYRSSTLLGSETWRTNILNSLQTSSHAVYKGASWEPARKPDQEEDMEMDNPHTEDRTNQLQSRL